MHKLLLILVVATLAFGCGYFAGYKRTPPPASFHDMLVNQTHYFSDLITPGDKRIQALAADLKTPQNAYMYVRDRIADDPSVPVTPPGEILMAGRASCLGKSVLLCSLYRAMGLHSSELRVVIGEISIPNGLFDHAWVEMEYKGTCIQQDTTRILGTWAFDHFRGDRYTQMFVRDEEFAFNDRQFVAVSQLNQFRFKGHPPVN